MVKYKPMTVSHAIKKETINLSLLYELAVLYLVSKVSSTNALEIQSVYADPVFAYFFTCTLMGGKNHFKNCIINSRTLNKSRRKIQG